MKMILFLIQNLQYYIRLRFTSYPDFSYPHFHTRYIHTCGSIMKGKMSGTKNIAFCKQCCSKIYQITLYLLNQVLRSQIGSKPQQFKYLYIEEESVWKKVDSTHITIRTIYHIQSSNVKFFPSSNYFRSLAPKVRLFLCSKLKMIM